ncbi:MAG: NAD(+)/NADH kinase, partial [Thermofilum sp.]|nr:NAD(+)/NADH kinase [Thermofilum sp.]
MPLKVYIVVGNAAAEVAEVRRLFAAHGMSEVGDPASADVILALGDDRAVLDAVSLVGEGEVPILGVSTGGSGYLTS